MPRRGQGMAAREERLVKRDPSHFAERDVVLIYIARRLSEALDVEKILSAEALDYCVEADQYHGGFLFRTLRTGAFFYVDVADERRAEEALLHSHRKPLDMELRTRH